MTNPTCPVPARRLERTVDNLVDMIQDLLARPCTNPLCTEESHRAKLAGKVADVLLLEFNPVLPTNVVM
jgi:hypothetical protein